MCVFVIVEVVWNYDGRPIKRIETDLDTFCKYKKWHSRMNAWNISITKEFIENSKIILNSDKFVKSKV